MGFISKIKKNVSNKLKEGRTERVANAAARKVANAKAGAAARKEFILQREMEAKRKIQERFAKTAALEKARAGVSPRNKIIKAAKPVQMKRKVKKLKKKIVKNSGGGLPNVIPRAEKGFNPISGKGMF